MPSSTFWSWLVQIGAIQGDAKYYADGKANPAEMKNAFEVAWSFLQNSGGKQDQKKFWESLVNEGYIEGDPNYYSSGQATPAEVQNAFTVSSQGGGGSAVSSNGSGGGGSTPATSGSSSIWKTLVDKGIIQGDPKYYESGQASEEEYSKAISVAFKGTAPGSAERKALIDKLWESGGEGDKNYWYNLPGNSGEVSSITSLAKNLNVQAGGSDVEVKALPRNSRLINVNGQNRVIWDLGDGLGSAWYAIDDKQLKNLFGENWKLYVTETFGSEGAYNAKYGDYYWGNIAEVQLTSENPWEDLKARTFEAFGYVAGFDDPEVKRIILQGHFEGWTNNEFLSHYQQTEFYLGTTEAQRDWGQKTPEEQAQSIQSRAAALVEEYRRYYGVDPVGGITNEDIQGQAEAIESGQSTLGEWQYNTRQGALGVENSPASREAQDEQRAQGQAEVTIENRGGYARERWEYWMGPTPPPGDFVNEWGRNLYMNEASEDDLEQSLRQLSAGTYGENKPENLGWSEWAAPIKANIRNTLELTSLDDNDPLLSSLLSSGLSGHDANLAIRQDSRFRSTNKMFDELSSSAHALGRTFGFIA